MCGSGEGGEGWKWRGLDFQLRLLGASTNNVFCATISSSTSTHSLSHSSNISQVELLDFSSEIIPKSETFDKTGQMIGAVL
jgi:hypothetical protein